MVSCDFCRSHFKFGNYNFIHLDVANPTYASAQSSQLKAWPAQDASQDLVTALSVWTHLNETDALFYMKEIHRVLKKDGKAIVTFFVLDDDYKNSLTRRSDQIGRFHNTNQNGWIFNVNAYGSENWFTVPSARTPEDAIGVTEKGMDILLKNSGFKIKQYYPGNWKENPGVFFQDILVLEKDA